MRVRKTKGLVVVLVAFAGYKTSGKDAAASVLIEEYGFKKITLADPVRDLAYAINPIVEVDCDVTVWTGPDSYGGTDFDHEIQYVRLQHLIDSLGWDYCKNEYPEVRRLLQAVGTEGGRTLFGQDFWVEQLAKRVPDLDDPESRYVLTDARFENEGRLAQRYGRLIWIDRPGLKSDGHASESGELRSIADHILTNDETLAEFQEDVRFMCFMHGIYKEDAAR